MNLLKSLGIPGPPPSFWNGNLKETTALVTALNAHYLFQQLKQNIFWRLNVFGKFSLEILFMINDNSKISVAFSEKF